MRRKSWTAGLAALMVLGVSLPAGSAPVSGGEGPTVRKISSMLTTRGPVVPPRISRIDYGRPLKKKVLTAASTPSNIAVTSRQILEGLSRGIGNGTLYAAAASPVISDEQRAALQRFADHSDVRIHFDRGNGTPVFLRFRQPIGVLAQAASQKDEGEANARRFLRAQRELFKLEQPDRELKLLRKERDAAGNEHLHFQQQWQGVPLWGKQLSVHLDTRKRVYLVNGRYEPSPKGMEVVPSLTKEESVAAVREHLGSVALEVLGQELVLHGEGRSMKLAYRVDVRVGIDQRWRYFIDARSGTILHRIRNIHAGRVVEAQGADALDGTIRRFTAWEDGGIYFLLDPTRPENDVTSGTDPVNRPEATGDMLILDARNGEDQLWHVTSSNADRGWDPVAVSAAYNTRLVYEYYRDTFGRNSLDDRQMNLMVVIHFGQDYLNAFWNGVAMVYGDGDGKLFSSLVRCLDVAAHEMTHGVIEHTANLRYENQSGALNESFADFFGVMVDRDDWLIGEDCTLAGPGYLRDMRNPDNGLDPQPSRMSEYRNLPNTEAGDWGGVHVNSGIPNRAAYLTAERIGRDKTEQIYYRALRFYLTASSRFIDARRALIQAAEDLYGTDSAEVAAVGAAWDAVEVSEGGAGDIPSPRPTPLDPVEGDDLMIYLYPLDGVADVQWERFVLYGQNFSHPADKPLSDRLAFYTRPAAYTISSGTRYLFVGSDHNLHEVDGKGNIRTITDTGEVYSIAVSPDGRYFAYTSTDPLDDQIHLVDLVKHEFRDFRIVLPDYRQDSGASVSQVRYPDSLAFDYTGEALLFDVMVCLSRPDNACDSANPNAGFNYWTIGVLDLGSSQGSFYFPFPAQSPLFDLGYPAFAHNSRDVIVFDLHEYDEQFLNVRSSVVILDLERQRIFPVAEFGWSLGEPSWGVPSFWGGDDYVTMQRRRSGGIPHAVRVPLGVGDERWQGDFERAEQLNDGAVAMPLMHRAGQRVLNRRLKASTVMLDFGEVPAGERRILTLELANTGNTPVEITSISLQGSTFFSQNGINTTLPLGARLSVDVAFAPPEGHTGSFTGRLDIISNASPAAMAISIAAVATSSNGLPGSGGGAFFMALFPGLLGLVARLMALQHRK